MKTQRQRTLLALRLYAEKATLWWLLGFEGDSQGQRAAEQILKIWGAVDCAGSLDPTCVKCYIRVSVAEHLRNLSSYPLHSIILIILHNNSSIS